MTTSAHKTPAPLQRRRVVAGLATLPLLGFASPAVLAQADAAYPTGPVRMVIPFPPGGGADAQARQFSERLSNIWKAPVNADNVSGAGGSIAASAVARSRPDGQTIFFATHPIMAVNPFMIKKLPYDPVADFIPVAKLLDTPLVLLVPTASPIRSTADLVRIAKEKPGALNFGSGGIGTSQHLAGELFKQRAGVDLTHVPYRGNAQTTTALIANDIQLQFDNAPSAAAQVKGGRLRAVAVTSKQRISAFPDLPTIAETLPNFEVALAYGIFVPANTPQAIVARINRDTNQVLREPAFANRVAAEGGSIDNGTPQDFADYLNRERATWGPLLKRLNLQLD